MSTKKTSNPTSSLGGAVTAIGRSTPRRGSTPSRRRCRPGRIVDPDRARLTIGELAQPWLAGKINLKPTARTRYEDVLRTHVGPRWHDVPLFRVEHGDIQTWLAELTASGLSGASVRKAHGVLSGILGLALRDRRLPSNPASGVALPPLNQARRKL